jgi:hypothetical protein
MSNIGIDEFGKKLALSLFAKSIHDEQKIVNCNFYQIACVVSEIDFN